MPGLLNKILHYFNEPVELYRTHCIKREYKGLKKWYRLEYYSSYKIILTTYFSQQDLITLSLCENNNLRRYGNLWIDYKKLYYYLLHYLNIYKEKTDDMNGFLDGFWGRYKNRHNILISKILKFLPNDIIREIESYGI